jgi:cell division protein FtsB
LRLVARFRFRKRPLLLLDDSDSDARRGAARRKVEEPDLARRARFRTQAFVLLLAGVAGAGCLAAVIGKGGRLDRKRLDREIATLEADIAARKEAVALLEEEIRQLGQASMARERVAREELGLVEPGEISFLLPPQDRPGWTAGPGVPRPPD